MQACNLLCGGRSPSLAISGSPPNLGRRFSRIPFTLQYRSISRLKSLHGVIKAQASNVNIGAGNYEDAGANDRQKDLINNFTNETSTQSTKRLSGTNYLLSIAGVLLGCVLIFSLIVSFKGGPSALVAALAKSGFTAAFTLIFVSEIGDKTFFIAALLAMQYEKALVLLGSMGALSLMTVLSVIIGRIFQSVPSKFQTIGMKMLCCWSCWSCCGTRGRWSARSARPPSRENPLAAAMWGLRRKRRISCSWRKMRWQNGSITIRILEVLVRAKVVAVEAGGTQAWWE